jgi:two-component system, LuxR family, response regulator FixJ
MNIYLLDDDPGVREALSAAFQAHGLILNVFETPEQLLDDVSHDEPSCLILDLHLRGRTGMECLADASFQQKIDMPIIVLTGIGTVSDVVQSMKLGVVDFLQKPIRMELLIEKVREALKTDERRTRETREREHVFRLADQITDREREVVALICEGCSSKQIAIKMRISANTVANHRARLRQKTGASNTAELIRLVMLADAARKRKPQ